jgi:hypothetical protein
MAIQPCNTVSDSIRPWQKSHFPENPRTYPGCDENDPPKDYFRIADNPR